ncbi:MAG: RecX family transcriptional regulator [Eggerthellaceae bacterium]|nr:RecX family transcriptional regulator [Eggerthellaceae bacterium]
MANQEVISALQTQIDGILSRGIAASSHKTVRRHRGNTGAVDDACSCDEAAISPEDRSNDASAALKKIIALVNASDKSELAIRTRLANDQFNQNAIDEAVSQAKDYGFIDDARYADILIRSRISQQKGSAGIVRELAENGIEAETVEGWPYDYPVSHDEEIDRALSLLDRKPPRSKNKREAAYRRLMQRGYPSSVSSSAARMWTEQSC